MSPTAKPGVLVRILIIYLSGFTFLLLDSQIVVVENTLQYYHVLSIPPTPAGLSHLERPIVLSWPGAPTFTILVGKLLGALGLTNRVRPLIFVASSVHPKARPGSGPSVMIIATAIVLRRAAAAAAGGAG